MYNSNVPTNDELPSAGKLVKSTILAAAAAGVLLVTVVMPSEYGIDPTGVGNALGLKRMGEIKVSLAAEAEADKAKDAGQNATVAEAQAAPVVQETKPEPQPAQAATQNHEKTFTLAPDEGTELKVTMTKGAKVSYAWETDGGKANFDVHGDSKALKISYHPYYKGSDVKREGNLEAAFDGAHGWFWRNRTKEPLTITIKTNGEYTDIKRF
jgi:hypothetical protein